MNKIKITCDSTCDLTNELYEKHNIHIVPLCIALGDELKYDGENISAAEIFEYAEKTGELPKTSATSIGEYEEVFIKYVSEGYEVVHVSLSSELSASNRNACLAAEEIGNVHVLDSRNLSSGSGHLALLAAELAEGGMAAGEIMDILQRKLKLLDVSFVLQTLEYLHKGGRCSGIAAFGANALKIRPEIQVVDGSMKVGKKYRGSMEKTILQYVRGRLEEQNNIDHSRIFITHSGVSEEIVEKTKDLVLQLQNFEEVIETRAGCAISSHCGPACLGVLFFRTE